MSLRTVFRVPRSAQCSARSLQWPRRSLACSAVLQSGHNRWSKIKHDKGKEDSLKSKARTSLVHDVVNASKYGGSPDPSLNSQLVTAMANAKKGQVSAKTIEAAIARGQGKSISGAPLENVTIEAMLPHGVAAIIECQTEQKGRVLQDVRTIIVKKGGNVTPTTYLFDRIGRVWFRAQDGIGVDEVMDEAIDAGATEITMDEGQIVVDTDPAQVSSVAKQMEGSLKLQVERSEILFVPKEESLVELDEERSEEVQNVLNLIDEEPSLQSLYVNMT